MSAMSSHKDHSGVQQLACGALSNLASNDGMYLFVQLHFSMDRLCSVRFYLALVARSHIHNGRFFFHHSFCLLGNSVKIASLGGIEAIILAMSTHRNCAKGQQDAITALHNVACNHGMPYFLC
jgi:hypothetical protein